MDLQYVLNCIDENVNVRKKATRNAMIFGLVFILIGVLGYYNEGPRDQYSMLFICGGFGLLFTLPWIFDQQRNWTGKRGEKYKYILQFEPKELVWAYVQRINNRGRVSISVIMKFRQHKTFSVSDKAIPGRDTSAFLRALAELNPDVQLGYTKELERKFR